MKTQITKTIGKFMTAIALAVILGGAVFAFPVRQAENKGFERSVDWAQAVEKFEKMAVREMTPNARPVTEANQINFMLGHYLMRTSYDAIFAELDGDETYADVIEDIRVLIGFFEGKPEQVLLEKLLKSVENGAAGTEEIVRAMGEIEKSYKADQTEEQKWFLLYGEWTTCLIGDIFLEDDEYIAEDLLALQELAAFAPEAVAEQVVKPISGLGRFTEQDAFTAEDYEEMAGIAFEVFDLILGE